MDSTPGPETKIPHAMGQLNPSAITREKPMRLKEDLLRCNKKIDAAQKKYSMLPLQGTWVRSLVGKLGSCRVLGATKKEKDIIFSSSSSHESGSCKAILPNNKMKAQKLRNKWVVQ